MPIVDKLLNLLHNNSIPFKESGASFVMDCPRCLKKEKVWMYKINGYFVCWYCREKEGWEGYADDFFAELLNLPLDVIRSQLYDNVIQATKEIELRLNPNNWLSDPDIIDDRPTVEYPDDFVDILNDKADDGLCYLESRGIPASVAAQYKLHYSVKQKRIIFPVQEGDRLFGWQGRTIQSLTWTDNMGVQYTRPKMMGSKGTQLHKCLMFADNLLNSEHIIVCEGPVDSIKCHTVGGNVATMGKNVSEYQISKIRKHPAQKVYLALDPDAQYEIESLAKALVSKELYLMLAPKPYKDLGEMSFKEVKELFDGAPRYFPNKLLLPF